MFFEGQYISYEEMVDLKTSNYHPYFQSCINFCKDYLRGNKAFPINTSGSTGSYKTISLTRHQLIASAQRTIEALSLKKEYKGLHCISADHVGGKMMFVRAIELNMNLYVIKPSADITTTELPSIDFVAMVPLQLKTLLSSETGKQFLSDCKIVLVGGAVIEPEDESQLDGFDTKIYQTFGMTETASHIGLRRLNGPNKQSRFMVLQGVDLKLDERGCLVINGDITNNFPVVTNDLVDLHNDGSFSWQERLDNTINSGGYKVLPSKLLPTIKEVLTTNGLESSFTVVGLPDSKWGQRVTLVLESDELSTERALIIIAALKSKLHPYEVPKSIESIRILPRTSNGKIDYKCLLETLSAQIP